MWLIYALGNALLTSLVDLFGKLGAVRTDEYVAGFAWRLFALPVLIPLVVWKGFPGLGERYWTMVAIAAIVLPVTTIVYMRAIKLSPLSLTVPMLSFNPVFLVFTAWAINKEFPSVRGLVGILIIVAGIYLIHIDKFHRGILAPLKALTKEKGSLLMLLIAFIWSIGAPVDKIGIQHSDPVF